MRTLRGIRIAVMAIALMTAAAVAVAVAPEVAVARTKGNKHRKKSRRKARVVKRIPPLTADGLPNVQAGRAVVMDLATGAELFGKHTRKVGGIASTTKIFVALVVRRRGIDLDAVTQIDRVDFNYARGGARTRLDIRRSFHNIDLLRAMLMASDNRAPTALGRAIGLSPDQLVEAMNQLADELGLPDTHFTDPSGLRGNVSTPRDMAVALAAVLADPVLAEIMRTPGVTVRATHDKARPIFYRNTNYALHTGRHHILGGKTGYSRLAGYCLVIAARIAGRDVIMVFLDEKQKDNRWGDFTRVATWLGKGDLPPLAELPSLTGGSAIIGAAAQGTGSL